MCWRPVPDLRLKSWRKCVQSVALQSPGRELQRPKLQSYSTWSTSFSYRSLNLQSSATLSVEEPTEPRQRDSNSTSGFTRP